MNPHRYKSPFAGLSYFPVFEVKTPFITECLKSCNHCEKYFFIFDTSKLLNNVTGFILEENARGNENGRETSIIFDPLVGA